MDREGKKMTLKIERTIETLPAMIISKTIRIGITINKGNRAIISIIGMVKLKKTVNLSRYTIKNPCQNSLLKIKMCRKWRINSLLKESKLIKRIPRTRKRFKKRNRLLENLLRM